ncbi:ParB N-terminal domain-containing protein [Methanobrevibacter sp.]
MKIEKVKIKDLISPSYNPRDITLEEMEKLKTSIKEFGYITPIIVNKHNMHIVGGNQRYQALKSLGYNEIEVIYINEPDLNKEKAINIRLNKLSGTWDTVKLNSVLEEIQLNGFDVTLTGFNEVHLSENSFNNEFHQDIQSNNNNDYSNEIEDYDNNLKEEEYEFQELDDFKEINIDDFKGQHKCPKCGFEWNE